MDNNQYKELFINEAKEILANLNIRLVSLEKQPEDKDCLNNIFRQAHTLKGMAGAMGYTEIATLTHEMESVLDLLRQGVLRADKEIVDLLFDSFDALEALIGEAVSSDGPNQKENMVDIAPLTSEFKRFKNATKDKREVAQKEKRTNLRLDETDRREIIEKEVQGFRTYRLVVSLIKECRSKEARAIVVVKTLEPFGKVIRREFLYKQLESGKYGRHFGVFFITRENMDLIREKLEAITDVEKVTLRLLEVDEVLLPANPQAKPAANPVTTPHEEIRNNDSIRRPLDIARVPKRALDAADLRQFAEKRKQGFKAYRLIVRLSQDCEAKEGRAFVVVKALEEMGELIRKELLYEQLERGRFGRRFGVFFMTKENSDLTKEKVRAIFDVEQVISRIIELEEAPLSVVRQPTPLPRPVMVVPPLPGPIAAPLFQQSVAAQPSPRPVITHNEEPKDKEDASLAVHMVKVPLHKLDDLMDEVGELVINKIRLASIAGDLGNKALEESLIQMGRLTDELQLGIMDIRLVPMDYIFNRFPRLVRDVAAQEKKEVDFVLEGADIGLDRAILEEINEPLVHLLKNAISHGIELPAERRRLGKKPVGRINLSAKRDRAYVIIEVSDDGRGINAKQVRKTAIESGLISREEVERLSDEEALMLITLPGFSTSKVITEASGRGVGMYSAKANIASFGGDLAIKSKINEGSRFILKLPLSMAIVQALLVGLGDEVYAIPLINISETIKIKPEIIKIVEHHEVISYRDEVLPLIRLKEKFGFPSVEPANKQTVLSVVVVEAGRRKAGLVVDKLLGQQEVVIKALGEPLKSMKGLAGATILGDGKVAAIVDVASLI